MRANRPLCLTVLTLCLAGVCVAQSSGDIDFNRARQLREKQRDGQKLTEEEQAYLDKAIEARRKAKAGESPVLKGASIGLKPLTDMTADDRYKGEDGGLYGDGKNEPPAEHREAALRLAGQIRPLDAAGKPADDGRIVLVSLGMSNTTQEFSEFVRLANRDSGKNSRLVLVDGAQGGMDARAWAEPDAVNRARRPDPWTVLAQRLRAAGVTPQQVQVVWIKQARAGPGSLGDYPKHADALGANLRTILHRLADEFPNLRIAYLSSRIYAGYANGGLNPEPYAYESAFAVRRLILDQAKGDESLNHDSRKGKVVAPLLLWGPYLWADGEKGRAFDHLVWHKADLGPDGTHPSAAGRQKVAELLLQFFKSDSTAKRWFTGE
jgi:hypothetical protein